MRVDLHTHFYPEEYLGALQVLSLSTPNVYSAADRTR